MTSSDPSVPVPAPRWITLARELGWPDWQVRLFERIAHDVEVRERDATVHLRRGGSRVERRDVRSIPGERPPFELASVWHMAEFAADLPAKMAAERASELAANASVEHTEPAPVEKISAPSIESSTVCTPPEPPGDAPATIADSVFSTSATVPAEPPPAQTACSALRGETLSLFSTASARPSTVGFAIDRIAPSSTLAPEGPRVQPAAPKAIVTPRERRSKYALPDFTEADVAALDAGIAHVDVWTDGSGTTSNLHAGIGVLVMVGAVALAEVSEGIGRGSNNLAELRAIRRAITLVRGSGPHAGLAPHATVTIYSDSEWAIGAASPTVQWLIREQSLHQLSQAIRAQVESDMHGITFRHCRGHRTLASVVDDADLRIVLGNHRVDGLAGRGRLAGIDREQRAARAEKAASL